MTDTEQLDNLSPKRTFVGNHSQGQGKFLKIGNQGGLTP